MTDIIKSLRENNQCISDIGCNGELMRQAANEIEQLREYRSVVHFIANDYYELSYDKIKWQRDDWRKRCQKVIEENSADD